MEVFLAYRDDLINRFDPIYTLFRLSFEINSNFQLKELGSILLEPPQYGANERAIDGNPDLDYRYIRITDIDEYGNLRDEGFKTAENIEERYKLKCGDVLFARSGATAGKCFIFTDGMPKSIFAGYLIRFIFDKTKVLPRYVFFVCQLEYYKSWVLSIQRPAGQPNVNSEEFKSFQIPLPPILVQQRIIQIMDEAYARKKQNEEEAVRLLNSHTELINEFIDINLDSLIQKKTYTINFEELEGALNPERYANSLALDAKYTWTKIKEIGDIVRDTFTPARTNPDNDYGLIRIDDLENNPQDAVIRDVKGNEINGIILKAQRNDILLARLDPTLENKKTIIVPDYPRELIASNEFIRFHCHETVNPTFVLLMLKTDFYKNMMIQKSRGAVPSRRRLSHEDFAELPFPIIDKQTQDKLAEQFVQNVNKAKQLKQEALEALEKAKKEVERIVFEGVQ
ncbi:MAG TPA: restriction endonuclease subunit S [Bacteroidales bacterium]|nr:restriction endonuclease subunit S [Bacteroidales bacterium]